MWQRGCVSDAESSTFYARDGLHVELRRDANGGFTFCGEDYGRAGSSDYEYWIGVQPEEFAKIRKALGEQDDGDILDQVGAHAEEIMGCGESAWLTERGIQYSLHSWGELPVDVPKSVGGEPRDEQREALASPDVIDPGSQAIDDHYFETRFADADGVNVPPTRYRTLEDATAQAEDLSLDGSGSIWYQNEAGDPAVEMVRYTEDGSVIDGSDDDDTNYPMDGVADSIEPGGLIFSRWLHDPEGKLAPYDFGFDWDGAHRADWWCNRGDNRAPGSSSCYGDITWSNYYDINAEGDEAVDDLGDDLKVNYTASSSAGSVSGQTLIDGASVQNPIDSDAWVSAADDLFTFLRGLALI